MAPLLKTKGHLPKLRSSLNALLSRLRASRPDDSHNRSLQGPGMDIDMLRSDHRATSRSTVEGGAFDDRQSESDEIPLHSMGMKRGRGQAVEYVKYDRKTYN